MEATSKSELNSIGERLTELQRCRPNADASALSRNQALKSPSHQQKRDKLTEKKENHVVTSVLFEEQGAGTIKPSST